jgi:hypothetical protein
MIHLRPLFRNPAFLTVVVILSLAAAALNGAVQGMDIHFKKERVELRKPLTSIPRQVGSWVQINRDESLPAEIEHALGTKDYIMRLYVNGEWLTPALRERLARSATMSEQERNEFLGRVAAAHPEAMVNVHLAYYTGAADTVAHVPERCMVGGGFDPVNPAVVTLAVNHLGGSSDDLRVKYVEFERRQRAQPGDRQNVAYLFKVNGQYEHDASTGVRPILQNIFERHAYYCKIELMTQLGSDGEAARRTMASFLNAAMPYIEAVLPDWNQVKAGEAPTPTASR